MFISPIKYNGADGYVSETDFDTASTQVDMTV